MWAVPISQRTQFVSIIKTNALMLLREITTQNCKAQIHCVGNVRFYAFNNMPPDFIIIKIIFIYCNWVVTRWQWLFYMYTKYEIGYY